MTPIDVLIADDNPVVRAGLSALLATAGTSGWWPRPATAGRPCT